MKLSNPSGGSVAGSPSPLVAVDASLYPDYPAGAVGDRLYIELGGKIGGVSGRAVETGDVVECLLANAGGSEAAVGSSWIAYEANIPGTTAAGTAMIQAADATAQAALLTTLLPKAGGTMTGLLTLTPSAANTGLLASTGFSLTGSNATSMVDLAGTWNTTGTPTALKLNVTDTASNSASLLIDLQVDGSTKASVNKAGNLTLPDAGGLCFGTLGTNYRLGTGTFAAPTFYEGGVAAATVSSGWVLGNARRFGWSSTTAADGGSLDLVLIRAAAATMQLGINNATTATAQTLVSHSVTTGTGANMIIGAGTGSVAGGAVILATRATTGALTARVTVAANGEVTIVLPTSAGTAGSLWNDTGTVKVA